MAEAVALLPEQADEIPTRRPVPEITAELRAALRDRYSLPEWALFEEVGFEASQWKWRTCDALAIHLWGSRGHEIHGFEIKATRSDWLREIRQVGKADAAARHCHRWWIVADRFVVRLEELPGTWGLMELVKGGKLRVRRQATLVRNVEGLTVDRLAGLLGRHVRRSPTPESEQIAYERGLAEGKRAGAEEAESRWRWTDEGQLRQAVAAFEKHAGVRLGEYRAKDIGRAVRFITEGGLERQQQQLAEVGRSALSVLEAVAQVMPVVVDPPSRYSAQRPTIDLAEGLRRGGLVAPNTLGGSER